jgi:hypothetical protein
MNNKRLLIGLTLISLFLVSATSQFASAVNPDITVSDESGVLKVVTDDITIKISPDQGNIMWWYGNETSPNEMYKLQITKIQEFMGDDGILDDKTEFGGVAYNLNTSAWEYEVIEGDTELNITLSLTGLANGADIYVIMHVYNTDQPINDTDEVVDALTELKFDIIVNNWDFSPMAQGYAIQTYLTEVQHHHRVTVRNGTALENGTNTRTMQFESDEYDAPVAYFEWLETAQIYNSTGHNVDTIDVGAAFFDDLISPPTEAPGYTEGLGHLLLTYPNYGDGFKMVHDPIIGINADSFTDGTSLFLIPLLGGLSAIAITAVIIKRRK